MGKSERKETDGFAFLQLGDNVEIVNCKGRFKRETPLGQSSGTEMALPAFFDGFKSHAATSRCSPIPL
jgi:hypothetical protein